MPPYQPGSETRSRLLEAAAEVFAEQGFRHARVSDICQRAQANIAAVNYHFGDKEQLYSAVIRLLHEETHVDSGFLEIDSQAQPDEQLRAYIRGFLFALLQTGPTTRLAKLMVWEMIEPTVALDYMIEYVIHPINAALKEIVGRIVGLPTDHKVVDLCVGSVLSQCMIYFQSKEIVFRMNSELINADRTYETSMISLLAEHVTWFSLRGMHGLASLETAESGTSAQTAANAAY